MKIKKQTEHKHKTKINNKSLKNIILMVLPVIAILGLIVSFFWYYAGVKKIHIDHFQKLFSENAKHKLQDLNNLLNRMGKHLEETGEEINQYDDLNHPDITRILQLSNNAGWFEYTVVADIYGNAHDNVGNKVNVSDREYFKKAMQGDISFSETMLSKVYEGEYVQIIANPIRMDNGSIRGVVFGIINTNSFKDIGFEAALENNENTYIVDSNGKYIAHFQANKKIKKDDNFWRDAVEKSIGEDEISKIKSDFFNCRDGEFTYTSNNSERYVYYTPIGPNKWQLVYSLSSKPVESIVTEINKLDMVHTSFVFMCYGLLTISIVVYFRKSNKEIKEATQEIETNMTLIRLSVEYTNKIVFEFDQSENTIALKTGVCNPLFNQNYMKNVPQSFVETNLIASESVATFKNLFEAIKHQNSVEAEIQISRDDAKSWYRISMKNILNKHNQITNTVGIVEDISDVKKIEEEGKRKLQLYYTLIENALIYGKVDLNTNNIMELNGEKTSIPYDEFLNDRINKKVNKSQASYVAQKLSLESLKQAYQQEHKYIETQFQRTDDGKTIWVSCMVRKVFCDNTNKVLFVITDIDKQKRKELEIKERAERDGLTGLYNSATARIKINEILTEKRAENTSHILVLFDLDNYKQINDTFGHDYGDYVLKEVASVLNNHFRSSDIIGRIGGDEFVILLRDIKDISYAEILLNGLCTSLNKTYQQGNATVTISASIGGAKAPDNGSTFEELYKKADIAQYQVKKYHKNDYKFYQE